MNSPIDSPISPLERERERERERMENQDQTAANSKGQLDIWKYMYGFVESMALKCAVDLRIADIIDSHGCPITLSQIASGIIDSPSPDLDNLSRIMRFLVHKNIFGAISQPDGGETLYTLTPSSKLLLPDAKPSLAPMVSLVNHPSLLAPFQCLSQCVKEGGSAFHKAHGHEIWDFASLNPEFNSVFNHAMDCNVGVATKGFLSEYKDGFSCIGSLVDVGGGTGAAMAEIVEAYPHIKGINFDLPHVIATAPVRPGVTQVGGDMFKSIPHADALLIRGVMHNWNDEDCIKILKSCQKAIPEKTGKIVILDRVLHPDGDGLSDNIGMNFDIVLMTYFNGAKERTELEWKKVLEEGGFPRYKIINGSASGSVVIEAYLE